MAETTAIHTEFGKKRAKLLNGLRDLGFTVDLPPEGTFYVWASAQHLPASISDGMSFFRAALEQQGDHGARRVLRRRSRQAPRRSRLALPPPPALLVRSARCRKLELALERFKELIADART